MLRHLIVVLVLAVDALRVTAGERGSDSGVEAIVPVVPEEHQRLHYFDRRPHHPVPGTVTINKAPYVCDLDAKKFRERDEFVAHVRTAHRTRANDIADRILVRDGVVHFVGE